MIRLFILSLLLILPIQVLALEQATVIFSKGDNYAIRLGKKIKLQKGSKVKKRDFIVTGGNGTVIIELKKGHRVKIRSNSKMSLQNIEGNSTKLYVKKGGILSKVNKLTDSEKYIVNTPSCVVGVRGTEFIVYVAKERKENIIAVNEVEVIVKAVKAKKGILVKANQSTKVEGKNISKSINTKWIKKFNWKTDPQESNATEYLDLGDEIQKIEYSDNLTTDDLQEWEQGSRFPLHSHILFL